MDNITQQKIRDFLFNPINLILIFIELVFLILVFYGFTSLNSTEQTKAALDVGEDLSSFEGIPADKKETFNNAIYSIVSKNTGNDSNFTYKNNAKIRKDTVIQKHFDSTNIEYVNFYVDIPELNQTYHISYEWSNDKDNKNIPLNRTMYALCPLENNFNCDDGYNGHGEEFAVRTIAESQDFSVENLNYFVSTTQDKETYDVTFNVSVYSCRKNKEQDMEKAENAFRDWVDGIGFSSSNLDIESSYYCEN